MSNKILTIGPDYTRLHGGIASLIAVYAQYDKNFKFLPTYSSECNIKNILLFPFFYLRIITFLLTHREFKIVHIHGASRISFYRKYLFFSSARFLKRKVIYHIHGGAYPKFYQNSNRFTKQMIRSMINNSDAIITLSSKWENYFKKEFSPKEVYILNNAISKATHCTAPLPHTDRLVLLYLGRISEEKGLFDLVDLIRKHKEYFSDKIKLILGGLGDDKRLMDLIKKNNLEDMIEYVGWVDGKKKAFLLNRCDLFILPSLHEGLPISILEAMSYKKPIIATDVGGVSSIVLDKINGVLVPPLSQQELFDAIHFFVDHKELLGEYGSNSNILVKEFLADRVIDQLHTIYIRIQA